LEKNFIEEGLHFIGSVDKQTKYEIQEFGKRRSKNTVN
jgi:hypothetical protein